VKDKLEMMS